MADFLTGADGNTELAYDLRQTYAKLVGDHMTDIAEARKQENFYVWYKNLEDLHTIVRHKFNTKKKPTDEEGYQDKIKALIALANAYPEVWAGQSKESKPFHEIELALREVEMFLYEKMNEAKMFGDTWKIAGL